MGPAALTAGMFTLFLRKPRGSSLRVAYSSAPSASPASMVATRQAGEAIARCSVRWWVWSNSVRHPWHCVAVPAQ
eukprot:7447560-Pyramimonas_sp.AAC.1